MRDRHEPDEPALECHRAQLTPGSRTCESRPDPARVRFIIAADKDTPYGVVVGVIDVLKAEGVVHIAMAVAP